MLGKKVYNITNHISDEKAEKIRRKSAKETAEIQAEATKEAARQQYWTAQQQAWAAEEARKAAEAASPEYQQRMAEQDRADREERQKILDNIERYAHSYQQADIKDIEPDSFVRLVQEYLHHSYYFHKEERNSVAKRALDEINLYQVPTDKERLTMFCDALERNMDHLKKAMLGDNGTDSDSEDNNKPGLYKLIIAKTDKAYDECLKNNPRVATEAEQQEIAHVKELEKTDNAEALFSILDIYTQHTEIQKWGSKKGSEFNPVGQVALKAITSFQIPEDKDELETLLQAVNDKKDYLEKLSRENKLLNFGNKLRSKSLYSVLNKKIDTVIKESFKDETDGIIGEYNQNKADKKKKKLIIAAVVILIILLAILFS